MATTRITAEVNGTEITGLASGTRYLIENTGDYPVIIVEAAAKPASINDGDAHWLAPRPYWPSPSRKIHQPGRLMIEPGSENFYAYGIRGDGSVVVTEAP